MKTVPFLAVSIFIIPHSVQKSNGILKFFQSAVVFVAFAQEMKKFQVICHDKLEKECGFLVCGRDCTIIRHMTLAT